LNRTRLVQGVQGRESPDSDADEDAYNEGVEAGVGGRGIAAARVVGVIGGTIDDMRFPVAGVWTPLR
jgi:hypothetical protein